MTIQREIYDDKEIINVIVRSPMEGFDSLAEIMLEDNISLNVIGAMAFHFMRKLQKSGTLMEHGDGVDAFCCNVVAIIAQALKETNSNDPQIIGGMIAESFEQAKAHFKAYMKEHGFDDDEIDQHEQQTE